MMKSKFVQYYVEGEDEEKLIHTLKSDLRVIKPGKVQKLNVIEHIISDGHLLLLRPQTMVVLIFDTDTKKTEILRQNLEKLKKCPSVSEYITIPQIHNLEDELVHSCDIKEITDLLGSKSKKEFKADFIRTMNLSNKLMEHQFDIKHLWCREPHPPYHNIKNQAEKIKLSRP